MDGGVRVRRVAAVFGVALLALAGILYLWWPAGMVVGIVMAVTATVLIGRRVQDEADAVPDDTELLALLQVPPATGPSRVVRTVLTPARDTAPRASIR